MQKEEIIEALKNQDEEGLRELLLQYGPLMRYVIAPILPDAHDQEECISETAMNIWKKINQYYESRGTWTGWITAVARNTAIDKARRNSHYQSEEIPEEMQSREMSPEEQVLREEYLMNMKRLLSELPQKEQLLIYRKYYYMQSTEQIAREMGMTPRAVEGRLYRIKKRLRTMLGGDGRE